MKISKSNRILCALAVLALLIISGACKKSEDTGQSGTEKYPEPRWPSYLKMPSDIEGLMPFVRNIVRNKSGFQGGGLGVANSGDTVAFIVNANAEDMIVQAVTKAMEERGVKVNIVHDYELVGVPKDQAAQFQKIRHSFTAEDGYMEAAGWIESVFPDPDKAKEWLKQQRPDLYNTLFPASRNLSPELKEVQEKMRGDHIGPAIVTYLNQHPEVRGVFWGKGGGTTLRRLMHPLENKFLGLFIYDNRWDVLSEIGTYPGDLWQLIEEKEMEPLAYVDRIEAKDPEGTNVWSDLTPQMAQDWAKGAYQRGHLYMFPNQATGRFGYSVVDYPAFQNEWLPREPLAMLNGTVAGVNGHTGFHPHWAVTFKNGYITDVQGGGVYGDVLRTFLKYPNINDKVYPFHNADHPGYWYLYEIAFGTHPKAFRNPLAAEDGTMTPERLRSGVIHWGLGITVHHDPGSPTRSQKLIDFTNQWDLPTDHGFHTHTYFTTYRVHLRNTDKWVTMLDKGHMTALDDAEVRALASRYGDATRLLQEDWVPEIPGINAPGNYSDYAANPWKTVKSIMDQAVNGSYAHYFPSTPDTPPKIDYSKQKESKPAEGVE